MVPLRLLIADDSADDAKLIAYKVKRAGFAVEWTRVEDAAEFARELPRADLVICDYHMPTFSPVRALEQIRESGLVRPLLLVSGNVTPETAAEIVQLGAAGCVLKDELERLGPAIHGALASRPAS
jgi:CheY-like chemotaxis protein